MDNDFLLKNFNEEKRRRFTSVSSIHRPRNQSFDTDASSPNHTKNLLSPGHNDFFNDRNHTFRLLSIASMSSQRSRRSHKSNSRKNSAKHSSRNRSHTSYIGDSELTNSGRSGHHSATQSPTGLSPSNSPHPDDDRSHRHRKTSNRRSPTKTRNHPGRGDSGNQVYHSFNNLTGALSLSTMNSNSKRSSMLNNLTPIEKFKRVVYVVQWFISISKKVNQAQRKEELGALYSFADVERNIAEIQTSSSLAFDPRTYRASTENTLTNEVINILRMKPKYRSDDQIKKIVTALKTIETFAEYPLKMQWALCKHGRYQSYEAMRVIIRQGHYAENYYMILSGSVVVSSVSINESTKELQSQTLALLKRGACFGELALVHHSRRNATVTCRDNVSLLTLSREAFMNLFMGHKDNGSEPDHIVFLRTVPCMQHIPLSLLCNDSSVCLFHYFRRGAVIVRDSSHSDWVYIVKSGYCEVLKKMRVKDSIPSRGRPLSDLDEFWKQHAEYDVPKERKHFIPSLPPLAKSLYAFQRISNSTKTSSSLHIDSLLHSKSHRRPKTTPEIVLPKIEDGSYRIAALQADSGEWILPDDELPGISQLDQQHEIEVQEDLRVHEEQLEEVYKKLYRDKKIESNTHSYRHVGARRQPKSSHSKHCYLKIKLLKQKEIYGLENLIFDNVIGTSLISNGAECIMISKAFLEEHLTNRVKEILRFETQPYPSDKVLKQNFQAQTAWNDFKKKTVKHILKLHNLSLD